MTDTTLENLPGISTAGGLNDSDIAYIVRPSTDSDYKASVSEIRTTMAVRKPQIICTQTQLPAGIRAGNTGGRADIQQQVRQGHIVGPQDVSHIQIGMVGYWTEFDTNAPEKDLGNSFVWEAGIETASPAMTRQVFFRGEKSAAIENGNPLTLSDPLIMGVAAGSTIYSRQNIVIADAAGKFPNSARPMYGASNVLSPADTSQVANTGALTTPASGITSFCRHHVPAIIGIPKNPMPSILVIGDSIAAGVGDAAADAYGNNGFIARGLANVNGYPLPWHFQAVPGIRLSSQKLQYYPKSRDIWQYCTHAILETGYNDLSAGTVAQMQADITSILNELKRTIGPYGKPLHVTVVTLCPSTTSSNGWIDAAGQTHKAAFVPGGKRDQYNAWLRTLPSNGLVDDIIDIAAVTDDPANPGKWYTNGAVNFPTADSVHPASGMVTRMSALVNTWALGVKP